MIGHPTNTGVNQHCREKIPRHFTMSSMITAAQWVPRGFAAPFPQKYTLDETEFARIAELAKLQLDDAEEDLKEAQDGAEESAQKGDDDDMKEDTAKPSKTAEYVCRPICDSARLMCCSEPLTSTMMT